MKIIAAQFTVRLAADTIDAEEEIEKLLETIGFEGPVDMTSLPDTKDGDVLHVAFEPVNGNGK